MASIVEVQLHRAAIIIELPSEHSFTSSNSDYISPFGQVFCALVLNLADY